MLDDPSKYLNEVRARPPLRHRGDRLRKCREEVAFQVTHLPELPGDAGIDHQILREGIQRLPEGRPGPNPGYHQITSLLQGESAGFKKPGPGNFGVHTGGPGAVLPRGGRRGLHQATTRQDRNPIFSEVKLRILRQLPDQPHGTRPEIAAVQAIRDRQGDSHPLADHAAARAVFRGPREPEVHDHG